jgi:hypothetical protein
MSNFSKFKWVLISKLGIGNLCASFLTTINLLNKYPHSKSIRAKSPIDLFGNPLPWYTYPALEYLDSLDFSEFVAFEYGSGNSTLWWASRVKSLGSVESDLTWYQRINFQIRTKQNVDYTLNSNLQTYSSDLRALKSDIVIIDGDRRAECARFLVENKNLNSILIFDNSDWYPETIKYLTDNLSNWTRVDFSGFGPINIYSWTTSMFIRKNSPTLNFRTAIGSRAGIVSRSEEDY